MATLPYGWDSTIPSGAPSPSGECHKWLSNFIWLQGAFSSSCASGGKNNKLVNGSVTTIPVSSSGWTAYDGARLFTSASGISGSAIGVSGGSVTGGGAYQIVNVQPDTPYQLHFTYKAIAGSGGWKLQELSDGKVIGQDSTLAETVFTNVSQMFVTSASAASVKLSLTAASGSNAHDIWYDEVELYSDGGGFHKFPHGGTDSGRHLLGRAAMVYVGTETELDTRTGVPYSLAYDTTNAKFKYYAPREEFDYDGEDNGPFIIGEELAVADTVVGTIEELVDDGATGSMTTVRSIAYAGTLVDDMKLVGQTSDASCYINGSVTQASAWCIIDDFLSSDTAITISSNIVFETAGGSVGGRNYSTDGAKLDGVAAEARHMVFASGTITNGMLIPFPQDPYIQAASGDNQLTNGDFDSITGSTTFVDSGDTGHAVSACGNTNIDIGYKKFGTSSINFDGNEDYLSVPAHADWTLGGDLFTIDFWVRFNEAPSGKVALLQQTKDASDYWVLWYWFEGPPINTSSIRFATRQSNIVKHAFDLDWQGGYPNRPDPNTFYHIALTRGWGGAASAWAATINGSATGGVVGDVSPMPSTLTGTALEIGKHTYIDTFWLEGQLDEVRISEGARWTENFTVPSAAYSSDASTKLLLHGDNAMAPADWTPSGSSCYLIVHPLGESEYYCEISAGSAGKYMYQDINIAPVSAASADYLLTFKVQPSSTIPSTPQYAVYDLSNSSYITNWTDLPSAGAANSAASGQWTTISKDWVQPQACASMRFMFAASGAGQQVFYDTIDVFKWCGIPTTPASCESTAWMAGIKDIHTINMIGSNGESMKRWYNKLVYHEDVAGAEIIGNGNFDVSPATSAWETSGTSATHHAGGVAGSCCVIDGGAASGYMYQTGATTENTDYVLDFYFTSEMPGTDGYGHEDFGYRVVDVTNGADIVSFTRPTSMASFHRVTHPFTTPSGCVSTRICLHTLGGAGGKSVSVDSVSCHPTEGHYRKALCYGEVQQCNTCYNTNYGYSCTCHNTCYGECGEDFCTCNNAQYEYVQCTCNNTCDGFNWRGLKNSGTMNYLVVGARNLA